MATMEDVARAADVSLSTVSHVLNGTRKVSPKTVAAVNAAMQQIGYVPNMLARALAGSSSGTIGVAISAFTNHYFSETVRAIEAACTRHGLMMLFSDTHDDPAQELKVVQNLHQRRVDGIVLAPSGDPDNLALNYLSSNKIASVLVDRMSPLPFDQVGVENIEATAQLVSHLITVHGHRRIGFIAGAVGLSTTNERVEGYRLALERAGIKFDPALVRPGDSNLARSGAATRELLQLDQRPTAIVAGNNLMTIGTMHALRDAHIAVPQEVALAGFDDFDWADYFSPRLTVMAQPLEELGSMAVDLLIERIANPGREQHVSRLAPTLRVRNSCGCA
ncbi:MULTISPECIES: LacI family DNA-binding transcriptional regulator [unclassified Janthinobacterium]|uniref:LacI family DNA-binding transcriptional regulator n=1 Tax=unclassified Janthinobacterium TaxID=2610881 RepID=UPI001614B820|nr:MULTISPECIES: LacI family DNA-binding transcriptional regulator [unclassified Janthinobacterium]MBB5368293.1 LacI family transcriptional regulator [Janthinobacterium sp. K2C7]MBB5382171.1 LacI family transcriptional regulator [Janthinobacterium sp. K2Li3]MBB5386675.1 LacI family transcriptional regulator [Janthinobacterium sp. K2E3]